MPFTPFHMGPGAAIKFVAGRHFSLTIFGCAQVAMDIEPLVRMVRGDAMLHGFTHTYLGATGIAVAVLVLGRPLCRGLLRFWNGCNRARFLRWAQMSAEIPWSTAAMSALVGTWSHVLLDSFMHADVHPWAPFNIGNGLLGSIPSGWLHLLCLALGMFGLLGMAILRLGDKVAIEID